MAGEEEEEEEEAEKEGETRSHPPSPPPPALQARICPTFIPTNSVVEEFEHLNVPLLGPKYPPVMPLNLLIVSKAIKYDKLRQSDMW